MGDSLTLHRAYAVLDVKAVDDEQRIIEGIASTPEVDRMGDIVEPDGAIYKLPIPLLWQHRSDQPIGHVISAKVTKSGIQIKAQIAKGLLPRIDEAWALLKAGLVRGLSIGFSAKEFSHIDGGHGLRFLKWEWLELSAVTIPANAEASITAIKQFDAEHLAASGEGSRLHTPAVAGTPVVKLQKPATVKSMKTIQERKVAFEAEKAAKVAKLNELMAGEDAGATLDESKQEEFDNLTAEIKSIEGHLSRLETLEQVNKASAVAVSGANISEASASRSGRTNVVSVRDNLPPGIAFARSVMVELSARLMNRDVLSVAKSRYPDHIELHRFLEMKAAVPAATTTQTVYAAPLVYASNLASEFIEWLRPETVIGKFGTDGIPALTRVPFNVRVPRQTSGGNAYWVGEGKGKPLTSVAFDAVTLTHDKLATIAVLTKEVVRLSTPSAEELVRNALRGALVEEMDSSFIDPASAGVAGVQPASITNGLSALSSAGTSSDNVITDIGNILEAYVANHYPPSGLVLIMPATLATVLGLMRNSLGQKVFPDINMRGGTLEGLPVITTQHAANASGAGNLVIAVHAPSILLADDGNVSIDASDQVSLQMSDTPTIDSTAGTGASLVSMWQTNSLAVKAEREITWVKGRSTSVVYMDDVNWGSVGSPS